MPVQELDRQVADRLTSSGVRYTSGRRAVVAALGSAAGPLSAAELHTSLESSLPLSSLYRTLMVLEGAGVLAAHFSIKGVARYEMAEWLSGHHHHLVCVGCGLVEDVELGVAQEQQLQEMVTNVASAFLFSAVGHALEIQGRCEACA